MRLVVALTACLALLSAFCLAPFQHVHHGGTDHDHSSLVHTHFYMVVPEDAEEHEDGGPEIEHPHDGHTSSPLDTFTVVPSATFALALPPHVIVEIPVPSISYIKVDVVEERGHSPPATALFIPRGPPV